MPVNPGIHFQIAKEEYEKASTDEERLIGLQKMLSTVPKHKGSENLQKEIKTKIAKIKDSLKKEKLIKKGSHKSFFKKEGAATISLVGTTNSGKSTLLKELTNANVEITPYPFTTKKPVFGIMDYFGIKLQIVEIPAIVENFLETEDGRSFMGIINSCDLIVLLFNSPEEKKILDKEINEVKIKKIIYIEKDDIKEKIWKNLNLIKTYTKESGKKPAFPPVALEKGSKVKDLGMKVHKDFIRKFKYAIVNGPSAKFRNQRVGLNHTLNDDDIIEFHIKK